MPAGATWHKALCSLSLPPASPEPAWRQLQGGKHPSRGHGGAAVQERLARRRQRHGGAVAGLRLIFNGCELQQEVSPAAHFLRTYPKGAYTSTRTAHCRESLLFWELHMSRLADSLQRLSEAQPNLYPGFHNIDTGIGTWLTCLLRPSLATLATCLTAWKEDTKGEEVAVTILVCGADKLDASENSTAPQYDVYIHMSPYVPLAMGKGLLPPPAVVAVMGPRRTLPLAKFSQWSSTRRHLERCCPSDATEVILSDDGSALLEGLVTNLFVVLEANSGAPLKGQLAAPCTSGLQVQTAALTDGVLPGIIRQQIIEICQTAGVPLKQNPPLWTQRSQWKEAFVTSSLRIVQPVATVRVPATWHAGTALDPWPLSQEWDTWHLPERSGALTTILRDNILDRLQTCSTRVSRLPE